MGAGARDPAVMIRCRCRRRCSAPVLPQPRPVAHRQELTASDWNWDGHRRTPSTGVGPENIPPALLPHWPDRGRVLALGRRHHLPPAAHAALGVRLAAHARAFAPVRGTTCGGCGLEQIRPSALCGVDKA